MSQGRTVCMNCGGGRLYEFLDLGRQPNGNNFPLPSNAESEPLFSLSMMVCQDCWQVQISEFPPQAFLFSDHPYITGANVPIVEYFGWLAPHVVEKLGLAPNSLVFDIGCNDGTLLKGFRAAGMRVLGIDPGLRTGELAKSAGITVCRTFWNRPTGETLNRVGLAPDVITATAVFYHLPDLHDFVEGLKAVMSPSTVFVVQCVYLKRLIERLQFDHFYHEHSCIHAIAPLKRLLEAHGLRLLDVEFVEVHGGSFILYVGRVDHPQATSPALDRAIAAEDDAGLFDVATYTRFTENVKAKAARLRRLIEMLRREGKVVCGLGAPVKGSTLLNYCGIGPDLMPWITEVNPFKIGRVTPGTHIPVIAEDQAPSQPDYYLLLSWNFRDFFVKKYAGFLASGGRIIVPEPEIEIISSAGCDKWEGA